MTLLSKSKFVRALKTLSPAEIKAFEKWLKSPYCNSNKNLILLFEVLRKKYPQFKDRNWSKEAVFHQILPHGKYSARRMNNILSEAFLALEAFLVSQKLSQNKALQIELLSQEWQERHQEDWFQNTIQKGITHLEDLNIKAWEDHIDLLKLYRRSYHTPNQTARYHAGDPTISKMGDQLDLLYLLEKATIINEKIFRTRILKDEDHALQNDIELWFQLSQNHKHPAIELFRRRFVMQEPQLQAYHELRKDFFEKFPLLNKKQQKVHLQSLFNDTSLLIRAGELDITDALPLYKLGLESGIIFHQGILPYNVYTSIIAASNTKGDFTFTQHVIHTYSKRLEPAYVDDALHWAEAHTAYWQKDFENARQILLKQTFKNLYFLLLSKVLTTQVYFDIYLQDGTYDDYLFNYFDAFEKWILREKFRAKFNKSSFLRFIQMVRKLARFDTNVNANPEQLDGFLEEESNVQALNWLHQKKEFLLKRKKDRSQS